MELHTIGIDLGKTVFHLVGLDPRGEVRFANHPEVGQTSQHKR
jgi:hypothetical protein